MFTTMHEESAKLRAQCHTDINRELDQIFNKTVDRAKLLEFEALYRGAQAGEWKLQNGQIVKMGKPVDDPGSLAFLTKCWAIVPALLAMLYRLETVIIDLIAKRLSARASEFRAVDALEKHRAEIATRQTTGSDHEFDLLIGCAQMGAIGRGPLKDLFRRWCQGHSIEAEVFSEYSEAVKRERELIGKLDGAPEQIKKYFRAYCRNQST